MQREVVVGVEDVGYLGGKKKKKEIGGCGVLEQREAGDRDRAEPEPEPEPGPEQRKSRRPETVLDLAWYAKQVQASASASGVSGSRRAPAPCDSPLA